MRAPKSAATVPPRYLCRGIRRKGRNASFHHNSRPLCDAFYIQVVLKLPFNNMGGGGPFFTPPPPPPQLRARKWKMASTSNISGYDDPPMGRLWGKP